MTSFRWIAGLGLTIGLIYGAEAQAQQPKVFNFGYVGRQTSPEGQGFTVFAEEIKKRSNGRFEVISRSLWMSDGSFQVGKPFFHQWPVPYSAVLVPE